MTKTTKLTNLEWTVLYAEARLFWGSEIRTPMGLYLSLVQFHFLPLGNNIYMELNRVIKVISPDIMLNLRRQGNK